MVTATASIIPPHVIAAANEPAAATSSKYDAAQQPMHATPIMDAAIFIFFLMECLGSGRAASVNHGVYSMLKSSYAYL